MAEDFNEAFDLDGDGTIATVDADGAALAAIQGLSTRLDEERERVATLETAVDRRDDRIDDLEAGVERRDERIEDLEATTEEQTAELDELRERVAALEESAAN